MRYFDSGHLLKLYFKEPNSSRAAELIGEFVPPPTSLQRLEMKSAFAQSLGRGEITDEEHEILLANFDRDLATGFFLSVTSAWDEIFTKAEKLADDFTQATLCRSLDTLHVAIAVEMGAEEFCTFDKRQSAMAKAAGLLVVS